MNNIRKRIHYINEVAKYETILKPYLSQLFKQFEGKKVLNADNELITKIKLDYPEYNPQPFGDEKTGVQYIITRGGWDVLMCEISLVFFCKGNAHYERDYIRLYQLKDNIITTPIDDKIIFINPDEEIKKIREYKRLSEAAYNIKTKIKVPEEVYRYAKL